MFSMHTSDAAQLQSKSHALSMMPGKKSLQAFHDKKKKQKNSSVYRVFWQTLDHAGKERH